ncbi:MAG: putative ATPase [Mycobacterium sp.]|nr:putative ATPase [Mycobacterium sp.]
MNAQSDEPARPSGVVTFLFTDIEGSTRRWEADADAMRTALEEHDRVLQEAIEKYSGKLFKHTGDGVCAAFASPRGAVEAAVAAQRAVELPVRMGIATGEAERRGDDYLGPVLNRAARVMSAGHGGQILLDGQTAGLLSYADLLPLGRNRLRDIARPVDVHQVRADGLRIVFPPLRTLDAAPGNLRPPTTSLVGRRRELTELVAALGKHRVVTLTGVGGVGKTRTALEAAVLVKDDFPDGVWVVELAALADPAAVPEAVAAVLGVTQQPGLSLTDSIAQALDGRTRLLVFDNCEHLVEGAADMIDAILGRSDTVRILATSREGLRVADERLLPLPGLDVEATAPSLFVERAQAVAPGISFTDAPEAVIEICRRLDGIPLAIELAASRMQSMNVTELRDRLDDRFRLLVGAHRGFERHQTLRHAVQWSYDLLDDAERSLLQRCSVFAGGFDLPSALAVAGRDDELATLDVLDALVRKSLLVADRSSATTRYSMLETIRQFAEEHLVAAGEEDDARSSHAHHFAAREPDVLALWDGPRQPEAYAWFTAEIANLRGAFRWAADRGDLDTAAPIAFCAAFLGLWLVRYEPVGWAEELLEPAAAREHPRLAQLYAVASFCFAAGRSQDALRFAEAARLAIASGRYDRMPCDFDAAFGGAYLATGQPWRWVELCRDVIDRDDGPHVSAQAYLAVALAVSGSTAEAQETSPRIRDAAEASGNPCTIGYALFAYGFCRIDDDPEAAYEAVRRGLTVARESGNRIVESMLASSMSRLAATHGDAVEAFDFLSLALRNFYDSGSLAVMQTPLAVLVVHFDRLGHHEQAATIAGFAANAFAQVAYPEMHETIGHLRHVLGEEAYEAFAGRGSTMTSSAMVTYAFEQIDLARDQLP